MITGCEARLYGQPRSAAIPPLVAAVVPLSVLRRAHSRLNPLITQDAANPNASKSGAPAMVHPVSSGPYVAAHRQNIPARHNPQAQQSTAKVHRDLPGRNVLRLPMPRT